MALAPGICRYRIYGLATWDAGIIIVIRQWSSVPAVISLLIANKRLINKYATRKLRDLIIKGRRVMAVYKCYHFRCIGLNISRSESNTGPPCSSPLSSNIIVDVLWTAPAIPGNFGERCQAWWIRHWPRHHPSPRWSSQRGKVDRFRAATARAAPVTSGRSCSSTLTSYTCVTPDDIMHLLRHCPNKQCALDPLPSFTDNHFPRQTFPGQDVFRTDVSRTSYTKEFSCI